MTILICDRKKNTKRRAQDETEKWAERALVHLAQSKAFDSSDREFGESLDDQLARSKKLSGLQWEHAIKLARRYDDRVGTPPTNKPSLSEGDSNGRTHH